VNSQSNSLERITLANHRVQEPFAVFPVNANPFDLAVDVAGSTAYVSLFSAGAVAEVDLETGAIRGYIGDALTDAGGDPAACTDYGLGPQAIYAAEVLSFTPGEGGSFGQDRLPQVVLGAPLGGGQSAGSPDVLSLGNQGQIVLGFGDYAIVDGPGVDFVVFENAFLYGPYQPFSEPALAALSAADAATDPASFMTFPCDLTVTRGNAEEETWPYPGCAGVHPVMASPASCIQPWDYPAGGGDAFDLSDLGLTRATYLRLTDAGISPPATATRGFDLDAVVLINWEAR
jgi:hypothetical protein